MSAETPQFPSVPTAVLLNDQDGTAKTINHLDAGMREHNHYRRRLSPWRYKIRNALIPIVRIETRYLSRLQKFIQTPVFDSYFAFTANLGTHTCFMVMLPIFIWCGHLPIGLALTQMLGAGVFISGFIKDMLCLPRPLSPPLQRITMSGSAALEYGFPSTHSTNAISVVVYALWMLQSSSVSGMTMWVSQGLAYLYAFSILFGRLYCGMHGFFDVVAGTLLGALVGMLQMFYGAQFENWLRESDSAIPALITCFVILFLVRIHPEPADDCPCFDDSVAFAGVVMGLETGAWHITKLARADYTGIENHPIQILSQYADRALFDSFSPKDVGLPILVGRIILGVAIIFAWRGSMKTLLLRGLPPVFRAIEYLGFDLPRRFFLRASEYTTIPPLGQDDNVIPPVTEIPGMVTRALRYPGGRRISVGPQSAADVYEALTIRQRRPIEVLNEIEGESEKKSGAPFTSNPSVSKLSQLTGIPQTPIDELKLQESRPRHSSDDYSDETTLNGDEEKECDEMFSHLEEVRARYDVEVVTKLIVYFGIAWLAVEGNPLLFQALGLTSGIQVR